MRDAGVSSVATKLPTAISDVVVSTDSEPASEPEARNSLHWQLALELEIASEWY